MVTKKDAGVTSDTVKTDSNTGLIDGQRVLPVHPKPDVKEDCGCGCSGCSDEKQNAILGRKKSGKVNSASCRCSGCKSDGVNPVFTSSADAQMLNTGFNGTNGALVDGDMDLHWQVGFGDASGPASVSSWAPAPVFQHSAWNPSPFGNARWIGLNSVKEYVYFRYVFNLASSVNPATFMLDVYFQADDIVNEIYVNGVTQSTQPNNAGNILPGGGFGPKGEARIKLDNHWRRCDNEVIVKVWDSGGAVTGLLVQNSTQVNETKSDCDCDCKCEAVSFPELHPCISVNWGDSDCDCIETDDVEIAYITVCNCYNNVTFCDFSIGEIAVTNMDGSPVGTLPNGAPSVEVVPTGPICFGDIAPCKGEKEESCVSREIVIRTRGAKGGKYKLSFNSICYAVKHTYHDDRCFTLNLCFDN